jgi:hypothetical protein
MMHVEYVVAADGRLLGSRFYLIQRELGGRIRIGVEVQEDDDVTFLSAMGAAGAEHPDIGLFKNPAEALMPETVAASLAAHPAQEL